MSSKKHTDSMRILFRVNADEATGLGHLSRCRSLAEVFIKKFRAECLFAINYQKFGIDFLKNLPISFVNPGKIAETANLDITIADIPQLPLSEQGILKNIAKLSIGIDDEGHAPFNFHALIRPNLLNLPKPDSFADNSRYLTGRDYIILSPDFDQYDNIIKTFINKPEKVLVCFGGSDPAGLSSKIIPIIKQLKSKAHFNIVMGAASKKLKDVESQTDNNSRFTVTTNCNRMSEQIINADLAIISGGTMLYETAVLGTPSLVLCQNQAQDAEASIFDAEGASINLGVHDQVGGNTIFKKLQRLLNNPLLLQQMSGIGPTMVARNGADSIARKILQWYSESEASPVSAHRSSHRESKK